MGTEQPAPVMSRLATASGLALALVSVVPLIGWAFGLRSLTVWVFDRAPVRPVVAATFLLVGALVIATRGYLESWHRHLAAAALLLFGAYGLIRAATHFETRIDRWLLGRRDWYDDIAGAGGLPVLTGLTMVTAGAALVMLRRFQRPAHVLLVACLYTAYVSLIGQFFGAHDIASLGNSAIMPGTTALSVVLASVAITAGSPPRGLLRYITDRGAAGLLVRPVVFVLPVTIPAVAWIFLLAEESGHLDNPTVVASVSASGLLIATALAWWAAARLRTLDRSRNAAYQRLADANEELEKRVAERTAEVEQRTALFTLAFEAAAVGMVLLDLSGRIVRANHALVEMTGTDAAALSGETFTSLLHADDHTIAMEQRRQMTSGLTVECTEELRVDTGPGGYRWMAVTGSVLPDAAGAPQQILVHLMDIDERKTHEHRLTQLANHDTLTGLLNRRGFASVLDAQIARVARHHEDCALLAIDLDNFKAVNDTCGHDRGDELLLAIADALRRSLRTSDSVARVGGDEFLALLPGADADAARAIAQKLVDAVREQSAELRTSVGIEVAASVGIALFRTPPLPAAEFLREADLAMYQAKQAGGDRWALAA